METPVNRNLKREHRSARQESLVGTASRPRVVVFRSNKNITAQLVDDDAKKTLAASSTESLKLKGLTVENATKVGEDLGAKAVKLGIKSVVFDRNGYLYHGRVKALADALRKAGLAF